MRYVSVFILLILIHTGCITEFVPKTTENPEMLVVESLISDRPMQIIKLASSLPLGTTGDAFPLTGCTVSVTDDAGDTFVFYESAPGTYNCVFNGEIGRYYRLHIQKPNKTATSYYESYPMEMKPVPPIDSLYYEKVLIAGSELWPQEGAQIYLSTHDPTNLCNYYRWEFTETWEFQLPYEVPNQTCWITNPSDVISIKSTAALASPNIVRYPINFISNQTDRLKIKYFMQVNQYSLTEDEFTYWDRLQNLSQQVGGLYDIIPSAVPGNVYCISNPDEKVLGYFSVSSVASKGIFVKDNFHGIANPYTSDVCVADTISLGEYLPNLNVSVWVIATHQMPDYKVISYTRACADCTTRGTTEMPLFWNSDK